MQSETILVVDDDAVALEFCCSVLAHDGYRVLRAESGENALDVCRSDAPIDMALVDVVMPGMSGIELVKRMELMERVPLAMPPKLAAPVGFALAHSQGRTCLLLLDLVGTHAQAGPSPDVRFLPLSR